jgi:hypothetical protein
MLTARVTVLQEHQRQMDDALVAYDEALANEDASQLSDGLLRVIQPATTDADLALSPTGDRKKLNGGTPHFGDVSYLISSLPLHVAYIFSIKHRYRMERSTVIHFLVSTARRRVRSPLHPTATHLMMAIFLPVEARVKQLPILLEQRTHLPQHLEPHLLNQRMIHLRLLSASPRSSRSMPLEAAKLYV